MTPAVVADHRSNVLGDRANPAQQIFDALIEQLGMLGERVVEVGDVGLVMLAVMDLHRLRIDVRLERRKVVWQFWQRMSSFSRRGGHCPRPEKCGSQTPHCATRFPSYLGSADCANLSGGSPIAVTA